MEENTNISMEENLTPMLEYETDIFLNVMQNDALIIAAMGLSMNRVLINFLKAHCDPGNFVIVLNGSDCEEKYYVDELRDSNVHRITCNLSIGEREEIYLLGGIFFITTRILVVDMLKKRVPIEKITGFVVLRAHSVLESCQEAFVLRLFRQNNTTGFIKGFTNNAQSFTIGYGHVERVMRTIFVKELFIWPRFHQRVIESLKKHELSIIELHIPISEKMMKIQTCILELMNFTVKELKKNNKIVEMQEITVENCLTKKFQKLLQSQLDCVWYQLSHKSKQLIADLKTLRHLLLLLFYTDVITFYSAVIMYRSKEYAEKSFWVFLEPAELLFMHSKGLVFTGDKVLSPEFCPKWESLLEILKVEIPNEMKDCKNTETNVLVLCQDYRTCHQLNEFLKLGPQKYLFIKALSKDIKFNSVEQRFKKFENISATEDFNETIKNSESEDMKDSYLLTMSQNVPEVRDEEEDDTVLFESIPDVDEFNLTQLINKSKPNIIIQTFKSGYNFLSLQKTLEDLKPQFIIMYHSDVTTIRQIELYEAQRKKDFPLKVYFLIHGNTVEEQTYLTSMRREKEAFELLIETKSKMVIANDIDGRPENCLQREVCEVEKNTRQGGQKLIPAKNFVIVDIREFRSDLPALIHKRGVDIEPLTITVGDYIITKDICVERKSLSDLVGSLQSGRLYQQCTQMGRYYSKPMLLIEFDQNRPFSWQNYYMISTDENNFQVQQKLLLLTLHFPKLKLIWSPSPYASAQLFEELKEGKEQPDIQHATNVGSEADMDVIETKYNTGLYDFIRKLPGINSKNINSLLKSCKNLSEILLKTKEELKDILGNSIDANAFYSIMHDEHLKPSEEQKGSKFKSKNKFKNFKNKK